MFGTSPLVATRLRHRHALLIERSLPSKKKLLFMYISAAVARECYIVSRRCEIEGNAAAVARACTSSAGAARLPIRSLPNDLLVVATTLLNICRFFIAHVEVITQISLHDWLRTKGFECCQMPHVGEWLPGWILIPFLS